MGALENLQVNAWQEEVRSVVSSTKLRFSLRSSPFQCYRNEQVLADISEYDGLPHVIAFTRGRYDNWMAPIIRLEHDGTIWAAYPQDEYYFARIAALGIEYGSGRVYSDMRLLYAMTDGQVRVEVVQELARIAEGYGEDGALMFNMMMHVYYGMVAEEHYQRLRPDGTVQRTRVGKMMKMHALYRMLIEHVSVVKCACECVGISPDVVRGQAIDMGILRSEPEGAYSSIYDDVSGLSVTAWGDTKLI